jgi:hypothetical protein
MTQPLTQPAPSQPLGMRPICHRDGRLTFWSASQRQVCALRESITWADLAAMLPSHRYKVRQHLTKHGWSLDRDRGTYSLFTGDAR